MAAIFDTDRTSLAQDDLRAPLDVDGLPHELLAPVIAGAFARGVAEAFDLLGVPALFLDREGLVLFVNGPAKMALAAGLQVRSGHLLGKARKDNRAVADFLAAALRDPGARPSTALSVSGLTLRALPVPHPAQDGQLLHAIVTIDDGSRSGFDALGPHTAA